MKSELEKLRKERGISSSFLAKKFNISQRQFRRIELGESNLKYERAEILAYTYRLPIEEIRKAYERSVEQYHERN